MSSESSHLEGGCPTCSHTMTAFGCKVTDRNFYVCPRCGTIKTCDGLNAPTIIVPVLIERCREFEKFLPINQSLKATWRKLGIAESINVPENRS